MSITYNIGIVGSRNFNKWDLLVSEMNKIIDTYGEPNSIISGGAKGADSMAEKWANNNGCKIVIHRALWEIHGKRAAYLRNKDIVRDSDILLAFPSKNGRGTQMTINLSQEKEMQIIIVDDWENENFK